MALISSLMFCLSLVFIFTRLSHACRVHTILRFEFNYPLLFWFLSYKNGPVGEPKSPTKILLTPQSW